MYRKRGFVAHSDPILALPLHVETDELVKLNQVQYLSSLSVFLTDFG
jgi:hypothetical protein